MPPARDLGLQIHVIRASTAADIDAVFNTLARPRTDALLISGDLFLLRRREQLVALAARLALPAIMQRVAALRLPAIYQWADEAEEGGFVAYGPRLVQVFRELVTQQLVKLLRGTRPADLPVEQPTKFELVINLKTANAMALPCLRH